MIDNNYSKENKMNTLTGFEKIEVRTRERTTGTKDFITVSDKSVAIRFSQPMVSLIGIEKGMFADLLYNDISNTFAIRFHKDGRMRVCNDGGNSKGLCLFTKEGSQKLFNKLGKKIKVTRFNGDENAIILKKFED